MHQFIFCIIFFENLKSSSVPKHSVSSITFQFHSNNHMKASHKKTSVAYLAANVHYINKIFDWFNQHVFFITTLFW